MPYILDKNGKYVYQFDEGQYEGDFDASQLESLIQIQTAFKSIDQFDAFMEEEAVKPISFTHVKDDGSSEELTLTGQQPANILREHKQPFIEAGRPGNRGAHLLAFALKNGMTLSELQQLSENPQDPRRAGIQAKLDIARKEFFATACCEDQSVQKERAADFYLGHIDAYKNELDKIIKSSDSFMDKVTTFTKLSLAFQSVGVQTLGLGKKDGSADKLYGQEIVSMVNTRLQDRKAGFTFENIYNLGGLGNHLSQNIDELKGENNLPHVGFRLNEEELSQLVQTGSAEYSKVVKATRAAKAFNAIYESISKAGESVEDVIRVHTDEKANEIHQSIKNALPPNNYDLENPEDVEFLRMDENARIDMRLHIQEAVYPRPVPPASFQAAMGGLIYGASVSLADAKKEKLPEDREFTRLSQAMLASRKTMSDPSASRDDRITAMRQVQLCADQYIVKNSSNMTAMTQERIEQAKMAFSVASGERRVLEGLAAPNRDRAYEQQDQHMDLNARLPFLKSQVAYMTRAIEEVDPLYVISSQAFKDTKKALLNLNKACKELDKAPSPEKLETLRKAFRSVSENAEIYVQQKSGEAKPSALGKKRLDFMKELKASMGDTVGLMSKATGKKLWTNKTAAEQLTQYSKNLIKQAQGQPGNRDTIARAIAYRKLAERVALLPDGPFNNTAANKAVAAMIRTPMIKEETASIINQAAPVKKAPSVGPQR